MYQAPVEGGLESLDITVFLEGTFSTHQPGFFAHARLLRLARSAAQVEQ